MSKNYGDNSIDALIGADRVRKRPEVMFGSSDVKGAFHTTKEITGNSLDEARAGYGDRIIITLYEDQSISVEDFGRGIPMGYNAKYDRMNWDLLFCELYAGGKYSKQDDGVSSGYEYALGLNGLGLASTQYASTYMEAVSKREEGIYRKSFHKGLPDDNELNQEPNPTGETGTFVKWLPDNEVFSSIAYKDSDFLSYAESQAYLNNVTIEFHNKQKDEVTVFEGSGILDLLLRYLDNQVTGTLHTTREVSGVEEDEPYKAKGELVIAFTDGKKSQELHYHATSKQTHGVHTLAYNAAVTAFFKKLGKKEKLRIVAEDYRDYFSVISSTLSNRTSFSSGQTKGSVSNQFLYQLVYNMTLDVLEEAAIKEDPALNVVIQNVRIAAEARAKAKEYENLLRGNKSMTNNTLGNRPEKLVDCRTKDPSQIELYVVEGDSALTACKNARDGGFQMLLPLKGKPPNALKMPLEKLLENEEVKALIFCIGTGVDLGDGHGFNIENLKTSKIIIATDADSDGKQIRVLAFLIFFVLMPQLLKEGYVYIAETPLFEIITKNETVFAYSDDEKDAIVAGYEREGVKIEQLNRSKGLGQNNPDMLSVSTMAPETRNLIQLKIDPFDPWNREVVHMLFGIDPGKERKDFVLNLLKEGVIDSTLLSLVQDPAFTLADEVNVMDVMLES